MTVCEEELYRYMPHVMPHVMGAKANVNFNSVGKV
jgi:hypothetical protein